MAAGYKKATVASGDVPASLTDYPSYVDLSRIGITTLAEAQSVRVYLSGGTELAREIVSASQMHVKVPSFTSTTTIYVEWDGVRADYGVTDTYGRNAVWSSYCAVYHLDHSSGNATDSTSGGYTLTNNGTTPFATNQLGEGADFGTSNTTKYFDRSSTFGFTGTAFSFSVWVKVRTEPSSSDQQFMVPRKSLPQGLDLQIHYKDVAGTKTLVFDRGKSGVGSFEVTETVTLGTASWHQLHMTYDTTTLRGYRNGSSVGTPLATSGNGTGGADVMMFGGYSGSRASAYVDELRVSNTAFSADWITTEYNNQSDEAGFWGTWTDVSVSNKIATVASGDVPATLANFPSYVDLSRIGITTLAQANSVRVYSDSDKVTEYPREIVSATEMHVKITSLTNTSKLYVEWDGVRPDYSTTSTYGRNNVWSDYAAVYHLESLTADSTSSGNTLTNGGTVANGTGQIEQGADTGSTNTTKTLNSVVEPIAFTSSHSDSYWVNFTTLPSGSTSVSINHMFTFSSPNFRRNALKYQGTNGFGLELVTAGEVWSGDTVSAGTWNLIYRVYDGTDIKLYLNGGTLIQTQTHSFPTQFGASSATKRICLFGADGGGQLAGLIDEARIKQATTSTNWMTTEYNNQSDEAGFWGTWSDLTAPPSVNLIGTDETTGMLVGVRRWG